MVEEQEGRSAGERFRVNGVEIDFHDRVITGREALTRSGNTPASEYQLILVRDQRTKMIETDDEIDLHAERGGELRAFPSDRCFGFTVDEVGQVWGAEDMEVDEFLRIWPAPPGLDWVLERGDKPDTVLAPGGVLSFGPHGVEHVVSREEKHPDKILVTVVTTAGVFPPEGVARYPATMLISAVLAEAKVELKIPEIPADWVVTHDNADLSPNQTFAQAHLSGCVKLEWGPREGGGGA